MDISEFKTEEYTTINGLPYYPHGFRDASGSRFYFGTNKGANCFIVLDGQTLDYFRQSGLDSYQICEWALNLDGKVSRLDLAVTEWIETELFSPRDVKIWYKLGLISSSLCDGGCKEIAKVNIGQKNATETLYVGDIQKRGKKGIFRAYDKGLDLGIGNELVSRIELELKREKSHVVAKRIALDADIAGNFRVYFDVNHPEFERIMNTPAVEVSRGKQIKNKAEKDEIAKRWEWLFTQVAPSLRDAIEQDYKLGLGNARMMKFLHLAGISKDAREYAKKMAEFMTEDAIVELGYKRVKVKLLDDLT